MALQFEGMPTCIPAVTSTTDASKTGYADILQAAAVVVAGVNTVMAIRMANLQAEIAEDYLKIAKAWRNYYNDVFRPAEDQELAEAWALPEYVAHHSYTAGQARNTGRIKMAYQVHRAVQRTSSYAIGLRAARIKDYLMQEAFTLGAMAGLGHRLETDKADVMDDRRWKKREQVLNRGRDMVAQNVSFSQLAAGIFGDLGRQAAEGAGGAMAYLGYSSARQPTEYPGMLVPGQQQRLQGAIDWGTWDTQSYVGGGGGAFIGPPEPGPFVGPPAPTYQAQPFVEGSPMAAAGLVGMTR